MSDDYFDRILEQQGLKLPSDKELSLEYAKAIEGEIVPDGALVFGVNGDTGRHLHMMPDELAYGLHIPGRPGMGKSTAGETFGSQVIDLVAEHPGQSFIVVDPHGPVASYLLRYCVKKGIDPKRVLYVDLARSGGRVPVFNPLRPEAFFPADPDRGIALAAYSLLEALTRAFGVDFAMDQPQTAETIFTAAAALAANRYSFAETRFFVQNTEENWKVRSLMLEKVKDPTVVDHWEEIRGVPAREQRAETASAARRFNYVLRSDTLRLMLGQTSAGIDFSQLLEQGTIAIFNLAQHATDVSDQGQRFLGALLLNQINQAVRRRQKNTSSPCYLFVDEFARFASHDTMEALAEARGFGLRLAVAHQRFDQLMLNDQDPRLLKAVLAIPNKLIFAMGLIDEQTELTKQAFGPWIDLWKPKIKLYNKIFRPILRRVEVHTYSEASGESSASHEAHSEAEHSGFSHGSGDMTGSGLVAPPGVDPTVTQSSQYMESSGQMSGSMRGSMYGRGEGRHSMAGHSVSNPYVTDHQEEDHLSHVEFQSFEEQIIGEMQSAMQQGVGDVTFMRGHREPPLTGRTPDHEALDVTERQVECYLDEVNRSHPGHFMSLEGAERAIEERKRRILEAARPVVIAPPKAKRKVTLAEAQSRRRGRPPKGKKGNP